MKEQAFDAEAFDVNALDVNALPLFELYTRLQEAGMPLGLKEYAELLKALQAGFGVSDRDAIARLCRALWVKSEEDGYIFDYHFAAVMGDEQQSFAQVARVNAERSRLAQEAAYAQTLTLQVTRKAMRGILMASGLFLTALIVLILMQPRLQPKPEEISPEPLLQPYSMAGLMRPL